MTAPVSPAPVAREEGYAAEPRDVLRIIADALQPSLRGPIATNRAVRIVRALESAGYAIVTADLEEMVRETVDRHIQSPRDPATDGVARDERGRG